MLPAILKYLLNHGTSIIELASHDTHLSLFFFSAILTLKIRMIETLNQGGIFFLIDKVIC